jgi:hypothetical protein
MELSRASLPTVSPSSRSRSSTRVVETAKSFGFRTSSATSTGFSADDSAESRTRDTETSGSS